MKKDAPLAAKGLQIHIPGTAGSSRPIGRLDLAVKEKCSKDASQLAEYMVERLKEWPPVPTTNMRTVETYATHERW